MNAVQCFPTLIWSLMAQNPLAINEELEALLNELRHSNKTGNPGVSRSNQGGWQSDFINLQNLPLFGHATEHALQTIAGEINISKSCKIVMNGCWINVNTKGCSNRTHTHPDSMLSGAYYVKTPPDSGRIVLHDPRPQVACISLPVDKHTPLTSPSYHHQPRSGEFVIFPSWLPHRVDPNQSDEERISVAFNMFFLRQ